MSSDLLTLPFSFVLHIACSERLGVPLSLYIFLVTMADKRKTLIAQSRTTVFNKEEDDTRLSWIKIKQSSAEDTTGDLECVKSFIFYDLLLSD